MAHSPSQIRPSLTRIYRSLPLPARPEELKKTQSIDVLDAVGSNIRVDSRGVQVMRILPRLNEDINEEWINDKTRFAYDGLKYQRLTTPLIRQGDRFVPASWPEALGTVAAGLAASGAKGDEIQAVAGALADTESLVVLKDLINSLGSDNLALDIVHLGLHGSRAATLQRRRNSTLRFLMRRQMPSPQFSRQSTTSPTHQRLCKSATSIRLGAWPMTILAAC